MKKCAMGLFHFNLQFVAGDIESYHREVRETFNPLLDLLRNHPDWTFDVELQGCMIEFMAEHYPYILKKLRMLVDNGQVELISCHYSDQIWIAFPKADMIKSIEINDRVLADHGLTRSRVFWTQENFFGEGVAELADYFDICVVRSSYYTWFQAINEEQPYYDLAGLKVLVAPNSGTAGDLAWTWVQCADAEPVCVADMPVNTREFFFSKTKMGDFEQKVGACVQAGSELCSVSDFVAAVDAQGLNPKPFGPVLDGAWNMAQCHGPFQWMGRYAAPYEDDCVIRSHNVRSRNRLLAAETLVAHAEAQGIDVTAQAPLLEQAWRHQLLAEVSDSTGWTPTEREVHYAVEESEFCLNIVQNVIDYVKCECGLGLVEVDTESGAVAAFDGAELARERFVDLDDQDRVCPWRLFGGAGTVRTVQKDFNTFRFHVDLVATAPMAGLSLGMDVDYVQYSPALMEDKLVKYDLADLRADTFFLPLPNGLISLREQLHVIKHNEDAHIACTIDRCARCLLFQVEHAEGKAFHWVFTLFQGTAEQALVLANRINVHPRVVV